MQSYDGEKIIFTGKGTLDQLKERMEELQGEATHYVVGTLPARGDTLEIKGLKYTVTDVDKELGEFHARLIRPVERDRELAECRQQLQRLMSGGR